ncbi:MAG: hypothetical protein OEW75_03065, partial [Cyclobacteriaceae bacterium]|nr:hypothetical protein [Cyclobacteriaceae bacterium]
CIKRIKLLEGPDGRPDQLRTDVRTNSEIRTERMSLPILDRCPDQFRTNVWIINSGRTSGSIQGDLSEIINKVERPNLELRLSVRPV